jgi:hypothetical protein
MAPVSGCQACGGAEDDVAGIAIKPIEAGGLP